MTGGVFELQSVLAYDFVRMTRVDLIAALHRYVGRFPTESNTAERFFDLLAGHPNCYERDCWAGHITGSAWVVDVAATRTLLTHHKKLDKWLQLGGHSDGDENSVRVALREATEESGLHLNLISAGNPGVEEIFDVDVHEIPARKREPAHYHFDIRFAVQAVGSDDFTVSDESNALAWVPLNALAEYTNEESMLRMQQKWLRIRRGSRGSGASLRNRAPSEFGERRPKPI